MDIQFTKKRALNTNLNNCPDPLIINRNEKQGKGIARIGGEIKYKIYERGRNFGGERRIGGERMRKQEEYIRDAEIEI